MLSIMTKNLAKQMMMTMKIKPRIVMRMMMMSILETTRTKMNVFSYSHNDVNDYDSGDVI